MIEPAAGIGRRPTGQLGLRPPDPVVTTRDVPAMWRSAAAGAAMIIGVAVSAVVGSRRR